MPYVGTAQGWTPTDASGAGLILSVASATYVKVGQIVHVWASLGYPSTTDAAQAFVGGLPFVCSTQASGLYQTYGAPLLFNVGAGFNFVQMLNTTTSAPVPNSAMSGRSIAFAGIYLAV